MPEIFEQASRIKLRFDTKQGPLNVEDVWGLPLTTTRPNQSSLDDLARSLDKTLSESGTKSFVEDTPKGNVETQLAFDIVIHIIKTKKAENAAALAAKANSELRHKLLEIKANKQIEALTGKSEAEIDAMLASIPA